MCPICRDECKDLAYAVPCRHEFCLDCILQWGKQTESCPICRRDMEAVKVAEWEDDENLNFIICPPATPVPACFQEARAPSFSSPSPSLSPSPSPSLWSAEEEEAEEAAEAEEEGAEEAAEAEEERTVGGILPEVWAELFTQHQQILDPVVPWIRQELQDIFDTQWWTAMTAEISILITLCNIGLDSEELMEQLWPVLEDETETFIEELIYNIVRLCGEEAHRLLSLQGTPVSGGQEEDPTDRGQEDSSVAAPGPVATPEPDITSGLSVNTVHSNIEEQTSTAVVDIPVDPRHGPDAYMSWEEVEPHEDMEQAMAAGPSAQDSSPSAPGHSSERARSPPKRKADSDQDPQPPCKRLSPQLE
ncbi:UNVERIFIED_CONTAM: hypothetical protein H355_006885 [Colinus virginianus]|nr:hypothetical protein H355_006885 [Colinus virginianus]